MPSPPSSVAVIRRRSRPLARSLWLLPRGRRADVAAVLGQLLWMEEELVRLHDQGGSTLGGEVMALSGVLSGVSRSGHPGTLLHPAWPDVAGRRAPSGMLLLEYLDGLNAALVRDCFRDAAALGQHARRIGGSAARLLGGSLGLPGGELAGPLDALGRWWVRAGLLVRWMPEAARGRIPFPLDELAAAGIARDAFAPGTRILEEEPAQLAMYRQGRAAELGVLLAEGWPAVEAAGREGAGAWVESLLAWRAAELLELRRRAVAHPSQPALLRVWWRRSQLLDQARA